jgi:ABC-2 type transport system ATP-binding protein
LLRELDLWTRRNDPVSDFSRGMQQKVAIACALVTNPPIVLLDEPTLGLDVHAARTVKAWVQELARSQGKTSVLTTHQLNMAEEVCDRVAIIRQGALVADKPTAELLELFKQDYYEIRVSGQLDANTDSKLRTTFAGLSIGHENGHTILSSSITDQTELYHLLDMVRHLNLPLLSVQQAEPKLEDVFVQLTGETGSSE